MKIFVLLSLILSSVLTADFSNATNITNSQKYIQLISDYQKCELTEQNSQMLSNKGVDTIKISGFKVLSDQCAIYIDKATFDKYIDFCVLSGFSIEEKFGRCTSGYSDDKNFHFGSIGKVYCNYYCKKK